MRGHTQPGNTVRVAGREATAGPDGNFRLQVNADKGIREITVQAEDTRGNRSDYNVPIK